MATLTPQAQTGLEYLRTINPTLADSISKSFSPASSSPISASSIGAGSNISVPPLPQTPIPSYGTVQISTVSDTGKPDVARFENGKQVLPLAPIANTAEQNALDAQGDALEADITAGADKLATKSARKSELESSQNIPQLSGQLNELNQLIRGVQAEALAATNRSEDRNAPMFAIRGEQAAIERQRAVKVYGFAAAAEAIQGNIALANDYVSRALAAEFDPIEQEIENKKFLLSRNKEKFDRAETRAAEERARELDQAKETLANAREDRSRVLEIMLAAAQNGADNQTLARIQNARTPEEAASAAGSVLGAKFAQDKKQQEFENSIRLAELAISRARLQNESAGGGIDAAQALAYAQQYMSTGTIPSGMPKGSFGIVATLAKEMPKPDGAIIDMNTGTKPAISDAKMDGLAALYDISIKVQQLKELDTQRYKGLIPAAFGITFGSDTQQKYVDLRSEIVDLLSRARTGAALTASEEKFYADQLPGRISNVAFLGPDSQSRITNFASKIEGTLNTKLKAQQASIVGFSKVNVGGTDFVVGQIVTNAAGQQGRVLPDGQIVLIEQ